MVFLVALKCFAAVLSYLLPVITTLQTISGERSENVADTATDAAEATVDFAEDAGNAIAKTFRRF